jgi:hypothetical protein
MITESNEDIFFCAGDIRSSPTPLKASKTAPHIFISFEAETEGVMEKSNRNHLKGSRPLKTAYEGMSTEARADRHSHALSGLSPFPDWQFPTIASIVAALRMAWPCLLSCTSTTTCGPTQVLM